MNCKEIKENISLYIDGLMSEDERSVFEKHIASCSGCAKLLNETLAAVKIVSEASKKQLPVGFYQRLNDRLDRETVKNLPVKNTYGWNLFIRRSATIFVLIAAVFLIRDMVKQHYGREPMILSPDIPLPPEGLIIDKEQSITEKHDIVSGKEEDLTPPDYGKTDARSVKKESIVDKKRRTGVKKKNLIPAPSLNDVAAPVKSASVSERVVIKDNERIFPENIPTEKKAVESELLPKSDGQSLSAPSLIPAQQAVKEEKSFRMSEKNVGHSPLPEVSKKEIKEYISESDVRTVSKAKKASVSPVAASPKKPGLSAALTKEVSKVREWIGYYSGYTASATKVITNQRDWETVWGAHSKESSDTAPAPYIDFNSEIVIAIFMGEQPTGGYSVRIVDILTGKDNIKVEYVEIIHEQDTASTQTLTQPYHIKVIKKTDLPILFRQIN